MEEGSGKLSVAEFDQVAYDITNFLYYVGEPARLERQNRRLCVALYIGAYLLYLSSQTRVLQGHRALANFPCFLNSMRLFLRGYL